MPVRDSRHLRGRRHLLPAGAVLSGHGPAGGDRGARELIVDDNVGLAENIAEILGIDGRTTLVAASAEEALAMAGASEPEVIVADYRLPGIDGADLVKAVPEDANPRLCGGDQRLHRRGSRCARPRTRAPNSSPSRSTSAGFPGWFAHAPPSA